MQSIYKSYFTILLLLVMISCTEDVNEPVNSDQAAENAKIDKNLKSVKIISGLTSDVTEIEYFYKEERLTYAKTFKNNNLITSLEFFYKDGNLVEIHSYGYTSPTDSIATIFINYDYEAGSSLPVKFRRFYGYNSNTFIDGGRLSFSDKKISKIEYLDNDGNKLRETTFNYSNNEYYTVNGIRFNNFEVRNPLYLSGRLFFIEVQNAHLNPECEGFISYINNPFFAIADDFTRIIDFTVSENDNVESIDIMYEGAKRNLCSTVEFEYF